MSKTFSNNGKFAVNKATLSKCNNSCWFIPSLFYYYYSQKKDMNLDLKFKIKIPNAD